MTLALKISDRVEAKTIAGKQCNETIKNDLCFRLVHDGKKAIHFFESKGFTITGHELIVGSEIECVAEAEKLGIELVEPVRMADI